MQAGKNAADEIKRLDRLKTHGLSAIPFEAPNKWRAKVVEELERFVNADRLPEWVSAWEAQRIVTGRVEEVLAPWRNEVEAQRKIQELIDEGIRYARLETISDWDYDDAEEARRDVEKALRAEVEPDWTRSQVRALVDEVLSEWDEDDEDEPDEDEDDD